MRVLPALLSACSLWVPVSAQHVAHEKYQLPNGMTVILREDHRLPTAVVNLWFSVGAKDEPPGRSGFAHLFEHLMFMGTERVPGNHFDVLMEQGGGRNNASTTEDRTNYFSEGPAALLPTLLWLEADRLEDMGRTMTQEKLDRQREIVRNELRQNVENAPYGRAHELVYRLLYPADHPYHEGVYGTHRDLEAATVADVKEFFATYYVPNNASLVVAGDFDPAVVKPLIAELFGTLPRGADVARRSPPPPRLSGVVRRTLTDKVQLPLVRMVWHSPVAHAEGDAELQLLAGLLAGGKSSRLYQRLVVAEQLASDVSAYQDSLRLGSMFVLDATCAPGADLDAVERAIEAELQRLATEGPTAAELGRQQVAVELRQLNRLQSLAAVADQLNAYQFAFGEPDSFARDLARYRVVTPAAVQRWTTQSLGLGQRLVLRVLPEQPARGASARDRRPDASAERTFAPPAPQTFTLGNGIPVHLWARPELPLVAVQVQFQPGAVLTEPARAGLPALTARMLQEGAGTRDGREFAEAMQDLGASWSTSADHEVGTASLTVLARNFDPALDLLAAAVRRPRFAAEDFARVHRQWLDGLRQQDDAPSFVATRVGLRLLFGSEHPHGWPVGGTVATVAPLTLANVQAEHARRFAPEHAVVMLAGDLTEAAARAALERAFGDWRGGARVAGPVAELPPAPAQGLRVVFVDRPEAVQTVVRLFAPALPYGRAPRVALQALNTLLGGSFTSRLNQNLREDHGYTYGAGSGWSLAPACGHFWAGADVQAEVTGPALRELFVELRRLAGERGDATADEVAKAVQTVRADFVQSQAGLHGLLSAAGELMLNGRPFQALGADLVELSGLTAERLNTLAPQALPLDRAVLVLVGDRARVLPQLEGLGLPPVVEVDNLGAVVRR
ncbi:MAG: insulinase family protein [Planctomycetes bacterium]|nr:insulinase family protein [Planctomycetota bacterium]